MLRRAMRSEPRSAPRQHEFSSYLMTATAIIAGASGVIGAAAAEHFAREGHDVVALSRRAPVLPDRIACRHLPLDLTDAQACRDAVGTIGRADLLVYAAVAEEPGLASGWVNPELIETNARMFSNLATPIAEAGRLRWAGLLQGTKAYGAHLHPITLPAREDSPRDKHENFYFRQEDRLRELAGRHGFDWTILRPQIVFGGAPGAAMNPAAAIGAYAALCRKMALPFAYPGKAANIWEVTDAALLASALGWASASQSAANRIFNVTNGDIFVLRHDWPALAEALGLQPGEEVGGPLAEFFARDEAQAAWRELADEKGLAVNELDDLLGQSHHYVDMLLHERMTEAGRLPVQVSTIKIRQAGFSKCRDSLESMLFWLQRMAETRLLPPMFAD